MKTNTTQNQKIIHQHQPQIASKNSQKNHQNLQQSQLTIYKNTRVMMKSFEDIKKKILLQIPDKKNRVSKNGIPFENLFYSIMKKYCHQLKKFNQKFLMGDVLKNLVELPFKNVKIFEENFSKIVKGNIEKYENMVNEKLVNMDILRQDFEELKSSLERPNLNIHQQKEKIFDQMVQESDVCKQIIFDSMPMAQNQNQKKNQKIAIQTQKTGKIPIQTQKTGKIPIQKGFSLAGKTQKMNFEKFITTNGTARPKIDRDMLNNQRLLRGGRSRSNKKLPNRRKITKDQFIVLNKNFQGQNLPQTSPKPLNNIHTPAHLGRRHLTPSKSPNQRRILPKSQKAITQFPGTFLAVGGRGRSRSRSRSGSRSRSARRIHQPVHNRALFQTVVGIGSPVGAVRRSNSRRGRLSHNQTTTVRFNPF